jgi:hypothetical protein
LTSSNLSSEVQLKRAALDKDDSGDVDADSTGDSAGDSATPSGSGSTGTGSDGFESPLG